MFLRMEAVSRQLTLTEVVNEALGRVWPQLAGKGPEPTTMHVTLDTQPVVIDVPPEAFDDVVATSHEAGYAHASPDVVEATPDDEVPADAGTEPDPLDALEELAADTAEDPEMCPHKKKRQSQTLGYLCDDCGTLLDRNGKPRTA